MDQLALFERVLSGASQGFDLLKREAIHFLAQRPTVDPVVLIHGYTSDLHDQFVKTGIFQALATRYRTIALDARGHGLSDKPHERAAYGPEMGLDIVRPLDHLGIRRAHVVGYSMGAHILAQLVTTHPSAVPHDDARRRLRSARPAPSGG